MTQRILQEERRLWKRGYKWVAGLDEVGRGSLAEIELLLKIK